MKKNIFKKAFAGIMAAALVMTSATFTGKTVHAADTTDIVDGSTGSLTIHKYEYNGNASETTRTGTGSTSDALKVPTGNEDASKNATPLADVKFKIYKVADFDLTSTTEIKYTLANDLKVGAFSSTSTIDAYMSPDNIKTKFVDDSEVYGALTNRTASTSGNVKIEQTTGDDGKATFSDLPIGLYLVEETEAPRRVTQKAAPFLVSIPTTVTETFTGESEEDSKWIYDVHVYPKNPSKVGSIIIQKKGTDLATNTQTNGVGATFALERKTGTAWTLVTTNDKGNSIGTITTADDGKFTIDDLANGIYRIHELTPPTGYIADTQKYYYFKLESGNASTSDAENGTYAEGNTITVNNQKPSVEKKVLKKGGNVATAADWKDEVDYSVNDTVTFKINVKVPDTVKNLKHFEVKDTFKKGLFTEYVKTNKENFTLKFYDNAGVEVAATTENGLASIKTAITALPANTMDDTVTSQEVEGWKLDLKPYRTNLVNTGIKTVEIVYTAKLTDNAVVGADGNINKIALEYSNKTVSDTDVDSETDKSDETTSITDEVVVYTFALQINKTFEGASSIGDLRATFDLYEVTSDGDAIPGVTGTDSKGKVVGTYKTDENGRIIVSTAETHSDDKNAISNGKYYLVETKTTKPYNLLAKPVLVTMNKKYKKTFETITTTTTYDVDGTAHVSSSVTSTGSTKWFAADGVTELSAYTVDNVNVINKKGFTLPVTGGKGTILFTVIGLVLMAAAVVGFFASKKRKANA